MVVIYKRDEKYYKYILIKCIMINETLTDTFADW